MARDDPLRGCMGRERELGGISKEILPQWTKWKAMLALLNCWHILVTMEVVNISIRILRRLLMIMDIIDYGCLLS